MDNYNRLIEYALKLVSGKRYTCKEMHEKLKKFCKKHREKFDEGADGEFCEEALVNRVMDRLEELRYLDDKSFVRDYVAQRVKLRPRGKFLIERELKIKGIDVEIQDIDEEEMAKALLEKKKRAWGRYSFMQQKNKAFMFLRGKGFKNDAIYKAVDDHYNL